MLSYWDKGFWKIRHIFIGISCKFELIPLFSMCSNLTGINIYQRKLVEDVENERGTKRFADLTGFKTTLHFWNLKAC